MRHNYKPGEATLQIFLHHQTCQEEEKTGNPEMLPLWRRRNEKLSNKTFLNLDFQYILVQMNVFF